MEKIISYLKEELRQSDRISKMNFEKFLNHLDIKKEFELWIEAREYPVDGIAEKGYTAKEIQRLAPFMNGLGVYKFLISLRETPEMALKSIADGFPRK